MSHLYGDELAPGALVGSFVVEELRCRGATSILYRASDTRHGLTAALKVLRRELSFASSALRRFQQEAITLQALRHPHIVSLLEHGELTDGRPYLAMEWLEGRDLAAELAARGCLGPPEALAVLEQVCSALAAAHRAGIIHRDLKAQNVMWLPRPGGPHVMLVDFGIAKLLERVPGGELTSTGRTLGTPIAMAPEQIRGGAVDARTDVYALGVLAYQLLTGRLPFVAPTVLELEELHLHAPAPRPSQHAPVPPAADAVVQRCLEKQPERRYAGVEETLEALRRALDEATAPCAPSRGAALYLEVDPGEEAGDAVLDRVDMLVEQAQRLLGDRGLPVLASGASFLLAAAPLPASPQAERDARRRLLATALELLEALETGREGLPIRVALTAHAARAEVAAAPGQAGPVVSGGELLAPAGWAGRSSGEGLSATTAMLEGLGGACRAAPLRGGVALWQVEGLTP